jgi:membrane-associated phospholipid phosphatase
MPEADTLESPEIPATRALGITSSNHRCTTEGEKSVANHTFSFVLLTTTLVLSAQTPGPTAPPQTPPSPATSSPAASSRAVSWKSLLPNILDDQKEVWTFPVRLARGQHLLPTAAVLGATAALTAADPYEASYFRAASSFHWLNNSFTGNATAIGTVAAPISLYVAGLIRKDVKMQHTALLVGEAVADSEILTTIFKDATRRVRPAGVPPNGNYWDNWFESGGSVYRGSGSFPSGHTIAVFSVATVISRTYGKEHRWVPYAAYGLAALVGVSRLTLSSHFLSDVFMGGALGYSISRFTVLRQ